MNVPWRSLRCFVRGNFASEKRQVDDNLVGKGLMKKVELERGTKLNSPYLSAVFLQWLGLLKLLSPRSLTGEITSLGGQ
jgi:hypothetical protein